MDRDEIIAELKSMHNHIGVFNDTELGRLVGFAEDEMDYYYIVRHLRQNVNARKDSEGYYTIYHSFVGPFVSLKDIYGERYEYMDNCFTMNGAPPSDDFIIKVDNTNAWFDDDPVGNELI